jgi:tetratricopeptide (TPR) repeat protein
MELTIEQALQKAVEAHKAGNLQDAEALYRAILKTQPKHPDANHNLGVMAVSLDKAGAALPLFKIALETNPNQGQFWLSYVDALIKEDQFDNARNVLDQAKKRGLAGEKVDAIEAQLTQNSKLLSKNNPSTTSQRLNKVSRKKEKKKNFPINLINLNQTRSPSQNELNTILEYYQKGQHDLAHSLATTLTQQYPNHPFGWKVLGALNSQTGKLQDSVIANQKVLELSPNDAEVHYNLGITLQELGSLEAAETSYKNAIAITPEFAEAHTNLGITLQELGRLEEAEISCNKAIAIKPEFAEAHTNLGIILKELGRLEEAETRFRKAIAIKPSLAEVHYNLGNLLKELGRLWDAEVSYKKAIEIKPNYAEAHSNLGNALKDLRKLDDAEASYKKAIEINPDYAQAHYNLGITCQELGRLEEALISYKKAIAINPDYAEAHSNFGNTLQELGRLEDAEASYKKAIAIKPDYADAQTNLGNTLKEIGNVAEAEASYKKAIAINPDYVEAHYNLGILLKENGRITEAQKSFAQAVKLKPDFIKARNENLTCFYLMDKKSLFYDELDCLIKEDIANSVVGSLTCRSILRYGEPRQNIFCNDPLKHILLVDLKSQYNFKEIFSQNINSFLNESKRSIKKQTTLLNGFQTSGNVFAIENNFMDEIQKVVRAEIERYRINFENSQEGLIRKWPIDFSLYGWLISMKSGGELLPHIHETGWLSGSIYINVPPKTKVDGGNLVVALGKDSDATNSRENSQKVIDVATGSMVMFPASLMHHTIPFESDEERIVLAFDAVPKKNEVL